MFKPDEIMQGLMANLRAIFEHDVDGEPDPERRSKSNHFVVWAMPGIPLQAEDLAFVEELAIGSLPEADSLEPSGTDMSTVTSADVGQLSAADRDRLRLRQARVFSELVNFAPSSDGIFEGIGISDPISTVLDVVLTHSEIAIFPNINKPEVEKLIADAEAVLDNDSIMDAFNERLDEYWTAADEFAALKIEAQFTDDQVKLRTALSKVDRLRANVERKAAAWERSGHKSDVENAERLLAANASSDLTLWRQKAKQRFDGASVKSIEAGIPIDFKYTTLFPTGFLKSDSGWMNFSFSSDEQSKASRKSIKRFQGGVSFLGFGGASGKGSISKETENSQSDSFAIRMKVAEVPISRHWLDTTFLESRAWRFGDQAKVANVLELSDGKREPDGPKGSLIGYTTSVIFAKDIALTSSDMKQNSSRYEKEMAGKAGARWGIFSFGGGGGGTSEGTDVSTTIKDGELSVDGMLAIGFRVRLLDKSPNPVEETDGIEFV